MDLEARKYDFIQKLFTVNEPLFDKLETLMNEELNEPTRISIEEYNKEIDEAVNEIETGNFYTQEEVRKIASQWGRQ